MARILLAVSCTLLLLLATQAEYKPDPQIHAVVNYFAKHGFKMEKATSWGWHVVDPKYDGYYIVVNFKSFPPNTNEEAMNKVLRETNLAHMLNAPARLAMSYPGLRGDAPGEPKHKAPDLKKLGIYDKMIKLFMEYKPEEMNLPPAVDIATGLETPSEGYCDQPYVVKLADGTWLCTMTTGKGQEGQSGQHIVSCRSRDRGKTWGPLVDIEPAKGPEASWVMPYLTTSGRVYVFYTYNATNLREVIGGGKRVDTLGEYAFKYSDDGGQTWSKQRWYIPVREGAIDRANPYQGRVRFFWGVGKPIRHKGTMYLGFAKVGKFGKGFMEQSESWFLRCLNIETEQDPNKLVWLTLPEGDHGLKSPEGAIAEEANLTTLSDGSLFCTYRTVAGHPCHAYSRDDGKSWTPSAFMTYRPGGELVQHPRAANFVRRLGEGPYAGRYIYWFHNHGGKGYEGRNPAYLLGGTEHDSPMGKVIHWGKPVTVLFDKDPKVRMSYPDFIWDNGLYITETQKTVARVHRIPDALLASLWELK